MRKRVIIQISCVEEAQYYDRIVGQNVFKLPEKEQPGKCCIDIGSYTGLFSICACINTGCRVYSFEPDRTNYDRSLRNIDLNGLRNKITLYKRGLWHSNSEFNFYRDAIPWQNQSCSFANTGGERIKALGITGEELFSYIKEPIIYYLKCNCEGGEIFLLRYLMQHEDIVKNIERMSIEVHPGMVGPVLLDELKEGIRNIIRIRKDMSTEIRLALIMYSGSENFSWMKINTL